ncbi:hypothetical protein LEP1GSC052_0043 [Leptospira kmetyi serovar Malaysia str. Bejo-Iso9]|nr:hypothetical protein LEP1GSC052_0043 [Leptospira kmetyi serovar Malaysia str. Bejo-Iso9]
MRNRSRLNPPTLETLNENLSALGRTPITKKEFELSLKTFSKNGKFIFQSFYAYYDAIKKYGIELFSMKLYCTSCNTFHSFQEFQYSKSIDGFYKTCKKSGRNEYQGYRRFAERNVDRDGKKPEILYYRTKKNKYPKVNGALNPFREKAIALNVKIFGNTTLKRMKKCNGGCKKSKPLAHFTRYKSSGKHYLSDVCFDCTAKRQRERRKFS